jgi:hypothetical protein
MPTCPMCGGKLLFTENAEIGRVGQEKNIDPEHKSSSSKLEVETSAGFGPATITLPMGISNGILEIEQNLVCGRIPIGIFIRHYWSPKLKELGNRILKALEIIHQDSVC